jgi:thioredoxin reductase (NADPH)
VAAKTTSETLKVILKSQIKIIGESSVEISYVGQNQTIPNEAIIVCAGGILPTDFLKSVSINMETKYKILYGLAIQHERWHQ